MNLDPSCPVSPSFLSCQTYGKGARGGWGCQLPAHESAQKVCPQQGCYRSHTHTPLPPSPPPPPPHTQRERQRQQEGHEGHAMQEEQVHAKPRGTGIARSMHARKLGGKGKGVGRRKAVCTEKRSTWAGRGRGSWGKMGMCVFLF